MRKGFAIGLAMLGLLFQAGTAEAATRAWLDRDQVALGESVTLTIETDQATAIPELAPLAVDFDLSAQSSNRQMQMGRNGITTTTTHMVNLTPRRAGQVQVPALQVGRQRTAPLLLSVGDAPRASATGGNARAFLETEVDDSSPYVQQSVGVTVRLYYAVPLASGQLDLDTPDGASLQRVGEDVQSTREVDGQRYNVVERRFLMVPERSGTLSIPAPRFNGRGAGGWMDDFLGGNSRELRATGVSRELQVRAQPEGAPQPWLPLQDLRLRYVAAPQRMRAGEAAELVVEATARGATQAQMPELAAPSVPGAQVFAEPPQFDERFVGGSSQVTVTRRYSIVPNGPGPLEVGGPSLAWWDVGASRARTARLPDLSVAVATGSGAFASPGEPAASGASDAAQVAGGQLQGAGPERLWIALSLVFAALWLLTLWWALSRRANQAHGSGSLPAAVANVGRATHGRSDLQRALSAGTLDEVGEVLRGMAVPPAADLDSVQARLTDPVQRDAVEQLRRARWANGDGTAARLTLREAFAKGPQWAAGQPPPERSLAPLYPQR